MAASDSPVLSVQDLKTWFDTDGGIVRAVDGVSFEIARGETLAIVGESGCGKSMTARSILRLIDPPGRHVAGRILLDQAPVGKAAQMIDLATLAPNSPELQRIRGSRIALVFQEPMASFSPVYTVGNQIIEAIRLHQSLDRRQARDKAIEMLRKVGVSAPQQRIDQYPHELSGGLLQRAMIAMALVCQPAVLIADEPTTALDVTTQAQIMMLLRDLQRETNMAILLITHDLGLVAQMASRVLVMYLGKVVEDAPVDAIFHAPRHPYTRALLRSTPRAQTDRNEPLATIPGRVPHPMHRPAACPFHNRCGDFMPGKCDRFEPQLQSVADGHLVSCFLYHEAL
jgi:oligopeptide/dipeptide ABC transporter ATP-binding protein